jgi:hypothetical protein
MPLSRLITSSFTPNGITLKDISTTPSQLNGMKNLLINGDFRIWQKGTDLNPASVGNGKTSVDRWTNQYCDFSPRIRRVEDTINSETVETVEITKNSGTYASCELSQKIETNVAKYLRGQTVTFSFWIKKVGASLGSHVYDCWIGDSETVDDTGWTNQRTLDRGRHTRPTGMTGAATFTSTGVWQKIKITRTLSADTNTIYCTIYTANTPVGEGIRVAKCQLEIGSIDSDFERRLIALEDQMCKRYYWREYGPMYTWRYAAQGNYVSSCGGGMYPTEMRATPAFAHNLTGDSAVTNPGSTAGAWSFYIQNAGWSSGSSYNGGSITNLNFSGNTKSWFGGIYWFYPSSGTETTHIKFSSGSYLEANAEF